MNKEFFLKNARQKIPTVGYLVIKKCPRRGQNSFFSDYFHRSIRHRKMCKVKNIQGGFVWHFLRKRETLTPPSPNMINHTTGSVCCLQWVNFFKSSNLLRWQLFQQDGYNSVSGPYIIILDSDLGSTKMKIRFKILAKQNITHVLYWHHRSSILITL